MRMPDGAALARAKAAASATMSPAGAAEVPGTPCSPAASSGGCRWRARCGAVYVVGFRASISLPASEYCSLALRSQF